MKKQIIIKDTVFIGLAAADLYKTYDNMPASMHTAAGAYIDAIRAIEPELNQIQSKCSARTITARDIIETLAGVNTRLNISKSALNGARIVYDINAQSFPRAYKYTPESTIFEAIYKTGSWRIINIFRGPCRENGKHLYLTESGKAAVIDRIEKCLF